MPLPKGYKHSEDAKRKISISKIGKKRLPFKRLPCSDECKKKHSEAMKGKPSWNKGKHMSDEAKKKLSLSRKNQRNSPKTEFKKGLLPWNKGRVFLAGDKNPCWKGGISFEPYCSKFNERFKESIRIRDNRTCQLCGINENGRKLHVHHIHHDKTNCYPDVISLCIGCHSKTQFDKTYYEQLFMNNLNERKLLFWSYIIGTGAI